MAYIAAGIGPSLWALVLLTIAVAAAVYFGRAFLSLFGMRGLSAGENLLFSAALGITAESLGVYILGLAGWLTRPAVGIFFGILVLSAAAIRRPVITAFSRPPIRLTRLETWILLLMTAACLLALIQALEPSAGMDALAYHLYLPKEFLRLGRMEFLPLTRESLWAFQTEMLFMAGLLFQGTILAQLFHWIFYPLTAAAVYLCTRRFFDARTALWAACFFIFTPVAYAQASYPYVDVSLAFFVFAAVYAFLAADRTASGRGGYALAGVFCGAAAGTKFLGLGALMILFPMVLVSARRDWKKSAVFLAAAGLVGGGWYVRSWVVAGNPVFPLFPGLFGGNGIVIQMDEGVGMGKGPLAFVRFLWNITLYPNRFGGQMIGAIFLTFLPALLILRRTPRRESAYLAFFGLAFTAFLFSQSQHLRFFVSVAPFLAIGSAAAFVRMLDGGRFLKTTAAAAAAVLLMLHAGIFIYRSRDAWPVVVGAVGAEDWLKAHERSYRGFDFIRRNIPADASVLNAAEVRYFYAPDGRRIDHQPHVEVLLRRQGGTWERYLNENRPDYIWVSNQSARIFLDYIAREGYQPVFGYDFVEKPDTFRNTIYRRPDLR